ncbi:MAG: chorismate mutase [Acidobacteria bacterium]|nr:MAG: chorismate mutase [Acidobacteriota bacterium]
MELRVVGIRGATSCAADTDGEITVRTQELVQRMISVNGVQDEDLVSILLTATDDLTAAFPARAVRELGYADVPLMGARELDVENGVRRCIRVLIHCYSNLSRADVKHVYLGEAKSLREDLPAEIP